MSGITGTQKPLEHFAVMKLESNTSALHAESEAHGAPGPPTLVQYPCGVFPIAKLHTPPVPQVDEVVQTEGCSSSSVMAVGAVPAGTWHRPLMHE